MREAGCAGGRAGRGHAAARPLEAPPELAGQDSGRDARSGPQKQSWRRSLAWIPVLAATLHDGSRYRRGHRAHTSCTHGLSPQSEEGRLNPPTSHTAIGKRAYCAESKFLSVCPPSSLNQSHLPAQTKYAAIASTATRAKQVRERPLPTTRRKSQTTPHLDTRRSPGGTMFPVMMNGTWMASRWGGYSTANADRHLSNYEMNLQCTRRGGYRLCHNCSKALCPQCTREVRGALSCEECLAGLLTVPPRHLNPNQA